MRLGLPIHPSSRTPPVSMSLGSGFNPFLWWRTVVAHHSQSFTCASRNLLATTSIRQQSHVKVCSALETYDGNVLMVDECIYTLEVEEGCRNGSCKQGGRQINQLTKLKLCLWQYNALGRSCHRQKLAQTAPLPPPLYYNRFTNWPGPVAHHQKFGHTGPQHDWQPAPVLGHKKDFQTT